MSALTIYVTGGFAQYADIVIVETTGKDISGANFMVALATDGVHPPTTGWGPPSLSSIGVTAQGITANNIRELKLLVTNTVTPGVYYLWAKFTDNNNIEIVPVRRISAITVV